MSLDLLKEDFFRIIGVLAWEQVAILVIYYKLLLVTEFVIDAIALEFGHPLPLVI